MGIQEKIVLYGNGRSIGIHRPPLFSRLLDGCACFIRNHFVLCCALALAIGAGSWMLLCALLGQEKGLENEQVQGSPRP